MFICKINWFVFLGYEAHFSFSVFHSITRLSMRTIRNAVAVVVWFICFGWIGTGNSIEISMSKIRNSKVIKKN